MGTFPVHRLWFCWERLTGLPLAVGRCLSCDACGLWLPTQGPGFQRRAGPGWVTLDERLTSLDGTHQR